MTEVVVISDDLSGGSAVGAEFARRGLVVTVAATVDTMRAAALRSDVLVVNTDTRNKSGPEAAGIIASAAREAARLRPRLLVKKIDSLLRGPISAEIESLMETTGQATCLVAASSPSVGRTTVDGHQCVHGRPLSESLGATDPSSNVADGDVVALLRRGSERPVHLIAIDRVERGAEAVAAFIRETGPGLYVGDATTETHLSDLTGGGRAAGIRLFAGSYGIGAPLSHDLSAARDPGAPVLAIAGSLSAATRLQVDRLVAGGDCARIVLSLDDPRRTGREIDMAMRDGRDVVLLTTGDPDQATSIARRCAESGTTQALEERIARSLSEACARIVAACQGIVVSGGSTAACLVSALGVEGLQLEGVEVMPGMPMARLMAGPRPGLSILIKPGSYGDADSLVVARDAMRRLGRRRMEAARAEFQTETPWQTREKSP